MGTTEGQCKNKRSMKLIKVIVTGGGFAGLQFVKKLDPELFEVLLIDKLNHHQFQPLFYQVATSQIEPNSISFPLRKLFRNRKNTQIRLAEVKSIIAEKNLVRSSIGDFHYDYLVIATGCKTNFFGNPSIEKYALGLKTTYDAIRIRNNVLENFERLLSAPDEEKEYLQNIVIVGAGPTGVELAGSFAEIKRNILPRDYAPVDFNCVNIILLEGSSNTLNSMSTLAKSASQSYLLKMGVVVKTGVFVQKYDGKTIILNNGEVIKSRQVIWTAGVTGNLVDGIDPKAIVNNSRILVDRQNLVKGYENVYALGDIACMATPLYPKGHPQVANVAINQAKNLARNLKLKTAEKPQKDYEYLNLGNMATVGRNKAVVDLPFYSFKGYFAWLIWMFLHLMLILSVRNKLIIFINWAWNYITRDTSLRLILKDQQQRE
jgi:NADH dehydrogenase